MLSKAIRLIKQNFPSLNPQSLFLISFFPSICSEMTTRMSHSIAFLVTEVKLWLPGSFLGLPSFPFLRLSWHWPSSSHETPLLFSKVFQWRSSLAVTSASSLSTHGCIPLGIMDLWVSSLPTWFLTQLFQDQVKILLSPDFLSWLHSLGFLRAGFSSRNWKKAFSNCSLSFVTRAPT